MYHMFVDPEVFDVYNSYNRSMSSSVRLASVVSELTVLFLPAAECFGPYGYQEDWLFYRTNRARSDYQADFIMVYADTFRYMQYDRWPRYSIRLASVVSELT